MTFNYSILIIGADGDVRDKVLEALGDDYEVRSVRSSDEALGLSDRHFDAVICDGTLAGFNVKDLLRQWKMRQAATPFLVLVNSNDVRPAIEAMKHGAADCLEKPIDMDDLRAAVSHLISARSDLSRELSSSTVGSGTYERPAIEIPPNTSLEDLERAAVEQALVQHGGNRTHAARALGISVRTLQRKLKAWGLPIVSFPTVATTGKFTLPGAATHSPYSFNVHAH